MQTLTNRQAQLLKILSQAAAQYTMTSLATLLGVSPRTIMREIDVCKGYLAKLGLAVHKDGQKISLVGEAAQIQSLAAQLADKKYIVNQNQRVEALQYKLLAAIEPIKLYALAKDFTVAESTVSYDLDKVEKWFQTYALQLTRRPGFGILLEGSESARRSALSGLLQQSFTVADLANWLNGDNPATQSYLARQFPVAMVQSIVAALQAFGYTERARYLLLLHILIALLRIQADCICESRDDLTEIKQLTQYAEALQIIAQIRPWLAQAIPEAELCYLATQLYGRRCNEMPVQKEHMQHLARLFWAEAWEKSGFSFSFDNALVDAVANHLAAALYRLRLAKQIHNPLAEEIKLEHARAFAITRQAINPIEAAENIAVPDAEIAYLAMYVMAALEAGKRVNDQCFHIVVCCPAGMSSAILLTSRLKSAYGKVVIDAVVPIAQLRGLKDVDLVVATVNCTCAAAEVVVVSPLFSAADRSRLDAWFAGHRPAQHGRSLQGRDNIKQIHELSQTMLRLLDHVFFQECAGVDLAAMIRCAAAAATAKTSSEAVEAALWEREQKGSVIIDEQNLLLLHARTAAVQELQFGLIRPLAVFYQGNIRIDTVIVMLVPVGAARDDVALLQHLTALIVESEEFQALLRQCSREELLSAIEQIFQQYLKQ